MVIATDDERIADGSRDVRRHRLHDRQRDHQSGTERIAEVADLLDWDDAQIVVNLQGDEPSMPAALNQSVRRTARLMNRRGYRDPGVAVSRALRTLKVRTASRSFVMTIAMRCTSRARLIPYARATEQHATWPIGSGVAPPRHLRLPLWRTAADS